MDRPLRHSLVSAAALAVYLVGLVGGGLHHHAHESRSAGTGDAGSAGLSWNEAPAADDDDEHTCAVCAAVQQVQTPALAIEPPNVSVRAEEVLILTFPRPLRCLLGTPHARAPPLV
jgi:hypothetical protein